MLTSANRNPKESGLYKIQPTMMTTNKIPVMVRVKKFFIISPPLFLFPQLQVSFLSQQLPYIPWKSRWHS